MKKALEDIFKINACNGVTIAVITLGQVRDLVSILLGLISIVSTLVIIRKNLRVTKRIKKHESS